MIVGLVAGVNSFAEGQTDITWIPTGTGDWNTDSNWTGGFAPDGSFGEQAIIKNGGTAQLTTAATAGPGNLVIADNDAPGQSGALNMSGNASMTLASGANVTRLIDVGVGQIGSANGGLGTLTLSDSASLAGNILFTGGQSESLLRLSDTSSLTLDSNATLRATTRIVGPGVTFNVGGNLTVQGTSTFVSEITGNSHSAINVTSTASVNGNPDLVLDFSGYSPSAGDSWDLISAPTINGSFGDITVTGYSLAPGDQFTVSNVDVGGSFVSRVTLDQLLTLSVNRDTGEVLLNNAGSATKNIDAYDIRSTLGTLGGNWNSLEDQGTPGWDEAPLSTSNALGELNPAGQLALSGASSVSLGSLYAPDLQNLPFGQSPQDVQFTYSDADSGQIITGEVIYTGTEVFNNLVLTVDPSTGNAQLKNDSKSLTPEIDAYTIRSASGSLIVGNWNSLDDQAVESGTWDDSSSANGSTVLAEFNPTDSTTMSTTVAFDLGAIFDIVSGEEDLILEYLLAGESELRTGLVSYGSIVSPPSGPDGDYNNDGVVDAADYTFWRDNLNTTNVLPNDPIGGTITVAQYNQWVANYGTSSATSSSTAASVPEPGSILMIGFGLAFTGAFNRRSV